MPPSGWFAVVNRSVRHFGVSSSSGADTAKNWLDQTARILWVLAMFIVPLFGVVAWLYAKSRFSTQLGQRSFRKNP